MKIIENEIIEEKTSVALGFFDGLHIAHKAVINEIAGDENPAVITFSSDGFADKTLISDKTKARLLEEEKIKYVCFLEFDTVKNMLPCEFATEILIKKFNAKKVSCGYNFRFGRNASGSAEDLKAICSQYGIEVSVIDELDFDGCAVSTTRIKELMTAGKISEANRLLGYNYFIEKQIVHGSKLGRRFDFPTINQVIPEEIYKPRFGVYASVAVVDGKRYMAVTNIGTKPTVSNGDTVFAETHIIGYNGDLYGKTIPVELVEFIRNEKKFTDVSLLFNQISLDKENAVKLLTKGGYNG